MREILFRGRRVDPESKGRFVEGWLFMYEGVLCIQTLADSEYGEFIFQVDPETVGQYTGMTDKNGTKIFEGDILEAHFRSNRNTLKLTIFWEEYAWMVEGLDVYENVSLDTLEGMNITVIGNIYDNPEPLRTPPMVGTSVS